MRVLKTALSDGVSIYFKVKTTTARVDLIKVLSLMILVALLEFVTVSGLGLVFDMTETGYFLNEEIYISRIYLAVGLIVVVVLKFLINMVAIFQQNKLAFQVRSAIANILISRVGKNTSSIHGSVRDVTTEAKGFGSKFLIPILQIIFDSGLILGVVFVLTLRFGEGVVLSVIFLLFVFTSIFLLSQNLFRKFGKARFKLDRLIIKAIIAHAQIPKASHFRIIDSLYTTINSRFQTVFASIKPLLDGLLVIGLLSAVIFFENSEHAMTGGDLAVVIAGVLRVSPALVGIFANCQRLIAVSPSLSHLRNQINCD